MRNLPAFVAVGVLGVVLGMLGSVGLANVLSPSAKEAASSSKVSEQTEAPLYGTRLPLRFNGARVTGAPFTVSRALIGPRVVAA